ncbi:hypothetical protein HDV00_006384 [Rhizophlyctis rosea]|nr:hypothetical protein HDV00_006384 [Rhizophlyctis rosea]
MQLVQNGRSNVPANIGTVEDFDDGDFDRVLVERRCTCGRADTYDGDDEDTILTPQHFKKLVQMVNHYEKILDTYKAMVDDYKKMVDDYKMVLDRDDTLDNASDEQL